MDYADLDPGDAYLMDSVDNTGLAMDLVDSVDNTGLVDWDMAGDDKAHKALVVHIPSII